MIYLGTAVSGTILLGTAGYLGFKNTVENVRRPLMTNQKKFLNGLIRWLPLVGLVLFFGLILWGYSRGIFHSVASLQAFIKQFGNYAVLCFILLQIVQVIIPILPGGISSVAGMLMFGNLQGLLYSYLGLIIGEFIGFYWFVTMDVAL